MKTKWTAVMFALAMAFCCVGCHTHSDETRTRKLSIEGPEKKTELKIETTDKK